MPSREPESKVADQAKPCEGPIAITRAGTIRIFPWPAVLSSFCNCRAAPACPSLTRNWVSSSEFRAWSALIVFSLLRMRVSELKKLPMGCVMDETTRWNGPKVVAPAPRTLSPPPRRPRTIKVTHMSTTMTSASRARPDLISIYKVTATIAAHFD